MRQNYTLASHPFNLAGMKPGDWFMGCLKCGQQLPVRAAGPHSCHCGGEVLIYDIHHKDIAEIKRHEASQISPLRRHP